MPKIGLIVDPSVDCSLAIERRIIPIDIFGDRFGNVASVLDARLRRGAVGSRMNIELMAGDVIGVSLRGLGQQWVDRIRWQSLRRTVGVDGSNDLCQFLPIRGVGAGGGGDIGAAACRVCGQGACDSHCR